MIEMWRRAMLMGKRGKGLVDVAIRLLLLKGMMNRCCKASREAMRARWKVDQKWYTASSPVVLDMTPLQDFSSQCHPRMKTCLDVAQALGVPDRGVDSGSEREGEKREIALTRAIIACFVDARLMERSICRPLTSSSILPSCNRVATLVSSFLASFNLFFFDGDTVPSSTSLASAANFSASARSRRCVASREHFRQTQSVRISIRVKSSRISWSVMLDCSAVV